MNHADDFDELAGLLPFYANGRLDAGQRARIDAALATMPALRAELAEVQALQARIKASGERLPGVESAPPAERLRTLQARIAAETSGAKPSASRPEASTASASPTSAPAAHPIQAASREPAAQARSAARRPRFRPSLGMALAAGLAIVCIGQAAMLYRLRSVGGSDEYASLSGPTDRPAAGGVRFTLRFRADTPWSDIQTLCEQLHLRIVDGPDDGRIDAAPADTLDAAQAEAVESALKRSPAVMFVGRQG
jgi:hypothetical protein